MIVVPLEENSFHPLSGCHCFCCCVWRILVRSGARSECPKTLRSRNELRFRWWCPLIHGLITIISGDVAPSISAIFCCHSHLIRQVQYTHYYFSKIQIDTIRHTYFSSGPFKNGKDEIKRTQMSYYKNIEKFIKARNSLCSMFTVTVNTWNVFG